MKMADQDEDKFRVAAKTSVMDRLSSLLSSEYLSDVVFIVGSDTSMQWRFPAHKFVVSLGSPVFSTMFNTTLDSGVSQQADDNSSGDNTNHRRTQVVISDVTPKAFENLLHYLYTDKAAFPDHEQALATLQAAHKYMVTPLVAMCVQYLKENTTPAHIWSVYRVSRLLEEPTLLYYCLRTIDENASQVLVADGFVDVEHSTLETVLSRDKLMVTELELFRAALRWADMECKRRQFQLTADNKRIVLANALFCIKLRLLEEEELRSDPIESGLLLPEEQEALVAAITCGDESRLPTPLASPYQLRRRYEELGDWRESRFVNREQVHCDGVHRYLLRFSVRRDVLLIGFGLYGRANAANGPWQEPLDLYVSEEEGKTVLAKVVGFLTIDLEDGEFRVDLPSPVLLREGKRYISRVAFYVPGRFYVGRTDESLQLLRPPSGADLDDDVYFNFLPPCGGLVSDDKNQDKQFPAVYCYKL